MYFSQGGDTLRNFNQQINSFTPELNASIFAGEEAVCDVVPIAQNSNFTPFVGKATMAVTLGMAIIGLTSTMATGTIVAGLPPIGFATFVMVAIIVACHLAPESAVAKSVSNVMLGVIFLALISYFGTLAGYGTQRLAFPFRDAEFAWIDRFLGFGWFAFVRRVDACPALAEALRLAYLSFGIQILIPVVVLGWKRQTDHAGTYLLAFAMCLALTILIGMLAPAQGHYAEVRRLGMRFANIQLSGTTPLDQLAALRAAGPVVFTGHPAGLIGFPSFHASVAIMVPMVMRRERKHFAALITLDILMLGGAITEGGHYFCDLLAGSALAAICVAYAEWSVRRAADRKPPATTARPVATAERRRRGATYSPEANRQPIPL